MVHLTPATEFHSGSGYQYEDSVIYGISGITYGDKKMDEYFIDHNELKKGKQMVITTMN